MLVLLGTTREDGHETALSKLILALALALAPPLKALALALAPKKPSP